VSKEKAAEAASPRKSKKKSVNRELKAVSGPMSKVGELQTKRNDSRKGSRNPKN
jgi:hypothetical protein